MDFTISTVQQRLHDIAIYVQELSTAVQIHLFYVSASCFQLSPYLQRIKSKNREETLLENYNYFHIDLGKTGQAMWYLKMR